MGVKAVIGLDIGNTTIKAAEVRVIGGRPHVTALGIAPTPPDSVSQSTVVDVEALTAAIRELLSSCGARERRVVSSVAGQQSLVIRIIEVPKMTEKELAETMKWEVDRHVPFASSELQKDYQVIHRPDAPPEAQTMEVLLVVAQQEMIQTHLDVVTGAGLDPLAIDVEPLASARALVEARSLTGTPPPRTVALVNVGAQNTDVSVVRDGNLLFQRTIAHAGDAITQAIANALNVNMQEAERIKKLKAEVKPEMFATAQPSAEDMFGSGPTDAFGFAPFGAPPEEPGGGASAPAFNPFAVDEQPQADTPGAESPFGTASAESAAPQWSPFELGSEEPTGAISPFAAAEEPAAGASAPSPFDLGATPSAEAGPSPFGDAGDTFDLSAFGGEGFGESSGAGFGGVSPQDLTPEQVFDIIREPVSDLVTEIKRSLDYYRGRSSDATVDVVMLSGGSARLKHLDRLLESELSVPVVIADPFQAVPVQSTRYPQEYLREIAPFFTVSVGLGLRETVF